MKLTKSKPYLDQDIIKRLSEPVVKDDSPVMISEEDSPKVSKKVFGIISKELIDNLDSQSNNKERLASIEEIFMILSKNLNMTHIAERIDEFINFIIKHINDSCEKVAVVAI